MRETVKMIAAVALLGVFVQPAAASDAPDGESLFNKKCKMCHALDKKKMGPAVKTMNSDSDALRSAIADGKNRMPKFGGKFSADEIDALVSFIQSQK